LEIFAEKFLGVGIESFAARNGAHGLQDDILKNAIAK
jgi:hypothetical protein